VLRLVQAADGFLARIRLPGGLVSGEQLRVLAGLATEFGDGRIELTSRGNVQLRGLAATAASALTSALTQAWLLPSLSHDRVRNVLASPLAGLDGGQDLTGLVRALDAALCARPRLADLPGRFLFAVDDGRGDVAGLGADVVAIVRPGGAEVNGLAVAEAGASGHGDLPDDTRDGVAAAMLACAEAFLDLRAESDPGAWRVADLPDGADRVRAAVAARLGLATASNAAGPEAVTAARGVAWPEGVADAGGGADPAGGPGPRDGSGSEGEAAPSGAAGPAGGAGRAGAARPVGLVAPLERGGAAESAASVRDNAGLSVVLLAPLGRLTAAQLTWVAERTGEREARVTPWRSIVLPHLADAAVVLREAAELGFGTDEGSPWLRVTACAGRPGCASALADVQADAAGFAARWPGRVVHVSGCERHCGRPAATEIDVTATSEGYEVAGI